MRKSADDSMPGGLRSARSNPTTVSPVTKRVRVVRDATIDFRMMRRAYLARVHAGDVPRHDACDASVDLVFAAKHHGVQRRVACPVCSQHELRNVTYLFGPRLPKAGKCVTSSPCHRAVTRCLRLAVCRRLRRRTWILCRLSASSSPTLPATTAIRSGRQEMVPTA